jgi:hypothetical protein
MKIETNTHHYGSSVVSSAVDDTHNRKPLGYTQYSGTVCQQSGAWSATLHATKQIINVERGHIMPYHAAQAVIWRLEDYSATENIIRQGQ